MAYQPLLVIQYQILFLHIYEIYDLLTYFVDTQLKDQPVSISHLFALSINIKQLYLTHR